MRLDQIEPLAGGHLVRVIIETPRGCRHKYAYDPELRALTLKKSLPEGMVFPFEFGFVPRTKGEDGDPLDVLVLADEATFAGCIVECRIIGVMEAEQKERGGKPERNDRYLAVAEASLEYRDVNDVRDLPPHIAEQIEQFFISYNRMAGKVFKPRHLISAKVARRRLKAACRH